jgi:hypothetical protein
MNMVTIMKVTNTMITTRLSRPMRRSSREHD